MGVKAFVERNFNILMCAGMALGFIVPGLDMLPRVSALILIAVALLFSCSRVHVEELRHIKLGGALVFYALRFLLLPALVYYVFAALWPDYAMGALLLSLAPVGASATAFATLTGGNASFVLSAAVVTAVLTPFVMPFFVATLAGGNIAIDTVSLLWTLVCSIFLPSGLYFLALRRVTAVKLWIRDYSSFFAILCISAMMAVVTAQEKGYILDHANQVLFMLLLSGMLFLIFYMFGCVFALRGDEKMKRAFVVCSGVMNTGLVTGLALLYFSPATVLLIVVAEVPWVLMMIVFKKYTDRLDRKKA